MSKAHAPACPCARDNQIDPNYCTCGASPKSCFISGCAYRSARSEFCYRCGAPRPPEGVIGRSPMADVKEILSPDVSKVRMNYAATVNETNDVDSYVKGVLRKERPFSIDGPWTPVKFDEVLRPFPLANNIRSCTLYLESRKLLGIHWWAERYSFTGMARSEHGADAGGMVTVCVRFDPVSAVVREKAAWWRRAGYALAKRLPGGGGGAHGDEHVAG